MSCVAVTSRQVRRWSSSQTSPKATWKHSCPVAQRTSSLVQTVASTKQFRHWRTNFVCFHLTQVTKCVLRLLFTWQEIVVSDSWHFPLLHQLCAWKWTACVTDLPICQVYLCSNKLISASLLHRVFLHRSDTLHLGNLLCKFQWCDT